jgi:hypothetical protein
MTECQTRRAFATCPCMDCVSARSAVAQRQSNQFPDGSLINHATGDWQPGTPSQGLELLGQFASQYRPTQ